MNSSLPSLLEAIFGKKDLSSVSLDEMYEVINEFPSFNAAHYLLSKKLKDVNDDAYNKVSLRTALYFNNPFWLQSILEDGSSLKRHVVPDPFKEEDLTALHFHQTVAPEIVPIEEDEIITETSIPEEPEQILPEIQNAENNSGTVTSFDELLSKYGSVADEKIAETVADVTETSEYSEKKEESFTDVPADIILPPIEKVQDSVPETAEEQYEISEEVLNEYGIFEEVVKKKPDFDIDDFDLPADHFTEVEKIQNNEVVNIEPVEEKHEIPVQESRADEPVFDIEEKDYEAFDRPLEKIEREDIPETSDNIDVISQDAGFNETETSDADNTGEPEIFVQESSEGLNDEIQEMTARFREQQQALAAFDPKKAESIVFAPYHMIDYFASQGIKLVLEDNPPDNFGKQLKSFTDWLKVMKKLPVKETPGKTEEKESERIRHFAAHSIEERDVLTESMAEVLAKQGMYENAIALYEKLSLIYPPKSAYFASRIDQLKAFLP